ncbi:hypothetical protein ERO13_D11G333301v2 [Gossypium hirsutum]|nr:hypothetical protein ERO13_D11G333301v2 [Gossypium hirsutum]
MYFKINSYQNGLNLNVYFILCRIFRFLSYLHNPHREDEEGFSLLSFIFLVVKVMLSFLGLFCVHLSSSSSSRFMGRILQCFHFFYIGNAFNCLE